MKLLVNDQAVDMQLQNEKTAWDLVQQLEHWLQEQGFTLTGLTIDKDPVNLAANTWKSRELSGIAEFAIDASSLSQLRIANLEILFEYAEGIHNATDFDIRLNVFI